MLLSFLESRYLFKACHTLPFVSSLKMTHLVKFAEAIGVRVLSKNKVVHVCLLREIPLPMQKYIVVLFDNVFIDQTNINSD